MKKLHFYHDREFKGRFELKELNLLLVFQVNCPGCFSYAMPLFNKLVHEFNSKGISFTGMSTAFEDFDKNTIQNTSDLISNGTLVGETKKFMEQYEYNTLPYNLEFPIVMDKISTRESLDMEEIMNSILDNYQYNSESQKSMLKTNIFNYLNALDSIALTFTLNQLKGTPSFVLFNNEYEIINEWFGHTHYEEIQKALTSVLKIRKNKP